MIKNLSHRHNIVRIFALLAIVIPFCLIFLPFFVPMLLAVFFAFGIEPLWKKIGAERRNKKFFPFYLLGFWFFFIFIPFSFISVKIVRLLQGFSAEGTKNSQLFQSLNTLWDKVYSTSLNILDTMNLEKDILPNKDEIIAKVSPIILAKTTAFLAAIPEIALSMLVFFGTLVVLVTRAARIKRFFLDIHILPENELTEIIECLKVNCYTTLVSTFLIGMLQAMIVAVGASIFGFHEFFLIFIITFLFSFIPVIGAAPVSFVLAIASIIMGQTGNGMGLIVVTIIAGSIDNIIKPYVFSGSDQSIHPIIALLGIIGAILVFGLPGLLIGPLLLQVAVQLLPKIMSKAAATNHF